jgi:hypothetical protein
MAEFNYKVNHFAHEMGHVLFDIGCSGADAVIMTMDKTTRTATAEPIFGAATGKATTTSGKGNEYFMSLKSSMAACIAERIYSYYVKHDGEMEGVGRWLVAQWQAKDMRFLTTTRCSGSPTDVRSDRYLLDEIGSVEIKVYIELIKALTLPIVKLLELGEDELISAYESLQNSPICFTKNDFMALMKNESVNIIKEVS